MVFRDGWDSSDIEFTPPKVDARFKNAGRKSIQDMLEHWEEDQIEVEAFMQRLNRKMAEKDGNEEDLFHKKPGSGSGKEDDKQVDNGEISGRI